MQEFPLINKKWQKGMRKAVIVFPNEYYGGIYALGPLILYNLINNQEGWICERRFLHNATDLQNFDIVGFSWQYELDLFKIKEIIKNNKISGKIFVGGPCVATNPEQSWADFCIIGEVEEVMPKILKNYQNKDILKNIQGVYIPNISIVKTYARADKYWKQYPLYQPLPEPLPKQAPFGKVFMLEIERSCPFNCKYCSIATQYNKIRYIPFKEIQKILDEGLKLNKRNKVAIYCPAFTHPQRKEILKDILKRGATFSIPSLRAEQVDEELIDLLVQAKQQTITLAPECGETLRKQVGKNISDKTFYNIARMASKKMQTIKLYFMVGLPQQGEQDIQEMSAFIENMQKNFKGKIYVSVNPFVPKPGTVFQDHPFDKQKIKQQLKLLKKNVHTKMKTANVNTSYKEWQISHGLL